MAMVARSAADWVAGRATPASVQSTRAGRHAQRGARTPAVSLEPRSDLAARSGRRSASSRGSLNARRGEWDSARLHDLGAVSRRLGALGQRLVPADRRERVLVAVQHACVLPSLSVARGGSRPFLRRARRPGRRHRLARGRCRRVRAALSPDPDPARRGRGPADDRCTSPSRRRRSSSARSTASRSFCSSRWRRSSSPSRGGSGRAGVAAGLALLTRSAGVALVPASPCSPGGRPTGDARSRALRWRPCSSLSTPCSSRSGSAIRSRSSTRRRSSGSGASRRPALSAGSSRPCSSASCWISRWRSP